MKDTCWNRTCIFLDACWNRMCMELQLFLFVDILWFLQAIACSDQAVTCMLCRFFCYMDIWHVTTLLEHVWDNGNMCMLLCAYMSMRIGFGWRLDLTVGIGCLRWFPQEQSPSNKWFSSKSSKKVITHVIFRIFQWLLYVPRILALANKYCIPSVYWTSTKGNFEGNTSAIMVVWAHVHIFSSCFLAN